MIVNLNSNNQSENNIEILQKETVESMKEYLPILIPKLEGMIQELHGELLEDTWEFLRMMTDGFEWVLEAYSGTYSYLCLTENILNEEAEKNIDAFRKCCDEHNEVEISNLLENSIIPLLNQINTVISNK